LEWKIQHHRGHGGHRENWKREQGTRKTMEKGTKEEKEKGNVNSKPNPTPFLRAYWEF